MKIVLILGAFSGVLAVFIGAIGAHAFKGTLEAVGKIEQYQTGVQYHWYHTLAVFAALWLYSYSGSQNIFIVTGVLFLVGILLFSGSLYAYGLTGIKVFAHITPVGGFTFIAGWILLLYGIVKYIK